MKKSSLMILLILLTASMVLFSSCSDNTPVSWQNHAPNAPCKPSPAVESVNNPVFVTLSWSCIDPDKGDILTYDVLAGKENPPEKIWVRGISENSFDLGYCCPETIWYWQVIARDNNNAVTKGRVWCFKTNESVLVNEETY